MIKSYTVNTRHNVVYCDEGDAGWTCLLNDCEVFKSDDIRQLLNDRITCMKANREEYKKQSLFSDCERLSFRIDEDMDILKMLGGKP